MGNVGKLMDARGAITRKDTDVFLTDFMRAFERWVSSAQATEESFDTFLERRERISNDYIQGDAAPLIAISTSSDPATFFPPSGDRIAGAAKVNAANKKGAKAFDKGSDGTCEVLQSGSSGGLAFWSGIQHADVAMARKKGRVAMQLRINEVFRVEDGEWKLVHRHADKGDAA